MYLHTERPNTCLTKVVKYRENTIRRSNIKPLAKCDETLPMHVQVFVTLHMSQNWSSTAPPSPQHNCVHSTAPVPEATATGTRHYHDRPGRWHTHILSFTHRTLPISMLRFPQNGLDMRVLNVTNTPKTVGVTFLLDVFWTTAWAFFNKKKSDLIDFFFNYLCNFLYT